MTDLYTLLALTRPVSRIPAPPPDLDRRDVVLDGRVYAVVRAELGPCVISRPVGAKLWRPVEGALAARVMAGLNAEAVR